MKTTFLILIFSLGSFIALHAQNSGQADTPVTEEMSIPQQDENQGPLFTTSEIMPKYKGDLSAFLEKNLHLPKDAQSQGAKPKKVFVGFTVNTDGSLSDIKVVKGLGQGYDEEAVRVMQLTSGNWQHGKQNGKNVKVRFTQPVDFALAK